LAAWVLGKASQNNLVVQKQVGLHISSPQWVRRTPPWNAWLKERHMVTLAYCRKWTEIMHKHSVIDHDFWSYSQDWWWAFLLPCSNRVHASLVVANIITESFHCFWKCNRNPGHRFL
jgi:hypothetical protein